MKLRKIFLTKFYNELMRNLIIFIYLTVINFNLYAQELNCIVTVNSDQINQTNKQIFTTLESSLNEFVNGTKWTNSVYAPQERIDCNMLITVTSYEFDKFSATLQVQSSRPVYNTSYQTPIFNYNDRQFNFNYLEFQPLFFNSNTFDSNLTSVITYYIYIILGMDADTFSLKGGEEHYKKAQNIVNLAQGSSHLGWKQNDGNRNRWELLDNLLSDTFKEYRTVMYNYHIKGMDTMIVNDAKSKQIIVENLQQFRPLTSRRPNSLLLQVFFDAKADEIQQIFSKGSKIDIKELVETQNKVAPIYASKWQQIRY